MEGLLYSTKQSYHDRQLTKIAAPNKIHTSKHMIMQISRNKTKKITASNARSTSKRWTTHDIFVKTFPPAETEGINWALVKWKAIY